MKNILKFIIILYSISIYAQKDDFNHEPWKNGYPIIIDPYHGNKLDFDEIIKDKNVKAVIHKASQGFSSDTKYLENFAKAKNSKLLFASYHLGTNDDPIKQADYYLNVISKTPNQPFALDIEDFENTGKNVYMPLSSAILFIKRIHEKTGVYPILYINNKVFDEINRKHDKIEIFSKCPLWYARFVSDLPKLTDKIWKDVLIWQFASEINCKECVLKTPNNKCKKWAYNSKCPYKVMGTDYDIDVDVFNGSNYDLNIFWSTYYLDIDNENLLASDSDRKVYLHDIYKKGKKIDSYFLEITKIGKRKISIEKFINNLDFTKLNGNPMLTFNNSNDYINNLIFESDKGNVIVTNFSLLKQNQECEKYEKDCDIEGSPSYTFKDVEFLNNISKN